LMVVGEEPRLKVIVSDTPAVALASIIACRREPAPESALLVTVKEAAHAGLASTTAAITTLAARAAPISSAARGRLR